MSDVTELLLASQEGTPGAVDRLMPLVYTELKALAAGYLRAERAEHTLQTTGLVHEAYLRLVDQRRTTWQNRAHFFGIAAGRGPEPRFPVRDRLLERGIEQGFHDLPALGSQAHAGDTRSGNGLRLRKR